LNAGAGGSVAAGGSVTTTGGSVGFSVGAAVGVGAPPQAASKREAMASREIRNVSFCITNSFDYFDGSRNFVPFLNVETDLSSVFKNFAWN
jgi:hypothetical protein